ncbi:MAG: hypothetical protein JO184_03905 [Gammaproteobacteria bacterium]|nr:hypothetical protein [Gammaproteobacteria bacterium]MBV8405453.1 hypothetical protein [Gammaproteobacteria bacterium]
MSAKTLPAAIMGAHARITDMSAMRELLEPLPPSIAADVRKLATRCRKGRAGMRYDAASQKAFWMQHAPDGVVTVVTFLHIATVEVAAELWGAMMRAAPICADRLSAIYAEVTGHTVEAIGTIN